MRVGIVGGGITGLSLLHHLDVRGVDAVCFEASSEPGGVIRSSTVDGRVVEHGPQRLRLSDPVAELVESMGLDDELIVADDSLPLYVYADGALRRVPRSIRTFLATDLLSRRGKLRVLAEPLTAPGKPDETVADLFARKFGDEAYRKLIGPLFGGMYASDPGRMPARHSLSALLRLEERDGSLLRAALGRLGDEAPPPASFDDGLQRLPRAIAERYDDRVHLGTAVTALEADEDGYVLRTDGDETGSDQIGRDRTDDDGNGSGDAGTESEARTGSTDGETRVDRVVVTTPAPEAAALLEDVSPDAGDRLRDLTYNPLALVHLRSDADASGFGYQVARDEGLHTLGVTWNASLLDRVGVFTAFLGGMTDPGVLERDDGDLGELAASEFAEVVGARADVLNVTRLGRGFPAYDDSWDSLAGLSLPPGVTLATNYTARMGIPSRVREARELADSLATDAGQ